MATEFMMPMLGEVMEEGRIASWHKHAGDRVEKGEIIVDVETDKVVMGVESPASGVLKQDSGRGRRNCACKYLAGGDRVSG